MKIKEWTEWTTNATISDRSRKRINNALNHSRDKTVLVLVQHGDREPFWHYCPSVDKVVETIEREINHNDATHDATHVKVQANDKLRIPSAANLLR